MHEREPASAPCELVVAGRVTSWKEGEAILFDDSFEHSAAYHGGGGGGGGPGGSDADESRIVLVVDVWHPMLSAADRAALSVLYPPGM